MPMMVLDRETTEEVLERRRALGNRTCEEELWEPGLAYFAPTTKAEDHGTFCLIQLRNRVSA